MIIFKNLVLQGLDIISAEVYNFDGEVALAKGAPPTQVVTQNSEPWPVQQGYLQGGFANASGLHSLPKTMYPGQTYAGFSPQTEEALNLTEQRALAGSPIQRASNQQLASTLRGDYLYGGPGFDAAYQAAANKIIPSIASRFERGGRYGSGLSRQAESSALGDAFASQYGQERSNQLQAMRFAPQAAQADYNDLRALAGVGAQREGQTQSAIDEAMVRHNYPIDEGWERLAKYMNMVQGTYGQNQTQTTTGFKGNRGAGVLGGALGGAGIGSEFGPWGSLGGGLLGGLLGLL